MQERVKSRSSRSDLLSLWYSVTIDSVRSATPDLSARQMAILMTVYLDDETHTVRSLSEKLGVTKAVITRALDSMSRMGLISRAPDVRDKRSIILTRTSGGILFLQKFADRIQTHFPEPVVTNGNAVYA